MHPQEIQTALRRRPFVPFVLHLSDGGTFLVRSPEFCLLTQHAVYAGIDTPASLPDGIVVLDMGHISRLECRPDKPVVVEKGE